MGELVRLAVTCTLVADFERQRLFFSVKLQDRGYPSSLIARAVDTVPHSIRLKKTAKYANNGTVDRYKGDDEHKLVLHLDYSREQSGPRWNMDKLSKWMSVVTKQSTKVIVGAQQSKPLQTSFFLHSRKLVTHAGLYCT